MTDFTSISYLRSGNLKQKTAYNILIKYRIMDQLNDFDPILVGTIPIGIDIETSDLDIICFWKDQVQFRQKLIESFSGFELFDVRDISINDALTTVANFFVDGFEIEIFGQNVPAKKQFGYRHMIIENTLLLEKGESFRSEILNLKREGYKTEPAFAKALGIKGDPYQELLKFERTNF